MIVARARRRSALELVLAIVVALGALLAATPARAEDADTKAAKKHFQKGEKLFNLGKFDDALVEYEAAYDRKPLPGFLYNIAQCHRNLGNYKQAIFGYRNYLRQVPEAKNREAVLDLIDELEEKQRELERAAERERAEREPPPPPPPAKRPLYKRGWFWGGVAAVTLVTVGAVVIATGDGAPATDLGNITFD
jgi:tetratricopeptide (TPR) repeat protein